MFAQYVTCLLIWALHAGSFCWRQSCSCFCFSLLIHSFRSHESPFSWQPIFPLFCCRFLSSFPQLTQHHYMCVRRVKHAQNWKTMHSLEYLPLLCTQTLFFLKCQWEVTGTLLSNMITYTSGSQTIWLMTLENIATSACDTSLQGTYAGQFFLGLNHI